MVILCLHTGIDLDKKKSSDLEAYCVACESAPLARHATRSNSNSNHFLSTISSRTKLSFPRLLSLLSNSRRATGHDAAIALNTGCESASYTVAPPRPHPRRQTDTSHPAAVAPQTTWVSFFSPSLTGAGQRWPRHHGPPSCSRPHASPHARTSTSPAAQVSPLRAHKPPLCRHLAELGPT